MRKPNKYTNADDRTLENAAGIVRPVIFEVKAICGVELILPSYNLVRCRNSEGRLSSEFNLFHTDVDQRSKLTVDLASVVSRDFTSSSSVYKQMVSKMQGSPSIESSQQLLNSGQRSLKPQLESPRYHDLVESLEKRVRESREGLW